MANWLGEDLQHARDRGMEESRRKGMRKKDTKRWCRGKVGVLHVPHVPEEGISGLQCATSGEYDRAARQWIPKSRWRCWHRIVCRVCGKTLGCPDRCPDNRLGLPLAFR